MSEKLPAWVDGHNQALLDLDARVTELRDNPPDFSGACEILVKLSEFKTAMSVIVNSMENIVLDLFGDEQIYTSDNGTTVEKKWDTNRKGWQHKDLAQAVSDRITTMAIDMDTGEVLLTPAQMIAKLLDFVQPSYWRLTPLRDVGINADDYCTVGDTKPVISVRRAK